MSRARHAALAVAVVLVNFLLFGFGFLLWHRLFYGSAPQAVYMAACFLATGAVLRLWSSKWWMVIVPSVAGYLWGLGALKWAIHLTDTRGEYAPPMAQYVFSPSLWEVLWGFAAAAAAGLGWSVTKRLSKTESKARAGPLATLLVLGAAASVPGCASVGLQSRDYAFGVTGAVTTEDGGTPLQDAEVTLEVDGAVYAAVAPREDRAPSDRQHGRFRLHAYQPRARGAVQGHGPQGRLRTAGRFGQRPAGRAPHHSSHEDERWG